MGHGSIDRCLADLWELLIVLAQTAITSQPTKSAFNDPAAWEDDKARLIIAALNNFKRPTTGIFDPVDELSAVIAIGPDQLQPWEKTFERFQEQFRTGPILDVSGMNNGFQHQSYCIDQQMALAPIHILARVVAAWSPFSVVLTLWLSMMAALGSGSRPSATRRSRRSWALIHSQVPSFDQRLKYPYTVDQFGKS